MEDESYDEACKKFAESMRLDKAIGTQLNLGLCYEKAGRFASAWINFEEARARAAKEGQENRVKVAKEYADALAGRLSKIRYVVEDPPDGLVVERDNTVVGEAQWGTEIPIDGGTHTVVARAPGKLSWETEIRVESENDRVEVVIPGLEDAPEPPPPPPTPVPKGAPPPAADATPYIVGGVVAGSLGVIGVGLGTAFGVLAMNKEKDSLDRCPEPPNGCTSEGVALRNDAFTFAHVSTAGFVVGGAGIATGLLLILLAPGDEDADSDLETGDGVALGSVEPWLDPRSGGGLTMRWRW
ncbi:MAG: tetratricopeptide repeat protein [Polyangiaceae bacterium]